MQGPQMFHPPRQGRSNRWTEACLLCLLRERQSYGYDLLERLNTLGFDDDPVNISVIYRNLRSMEERGLAVSSWRESEQGPPQRVYAITARGERVLAEWIEFLKDRRKRLKLIIDRYEGASI